MLPERSPEWWRGVAAWLAALAISTFFLHQWLVLWDEQEVLVPPLPGVPVSDVAAFPDGSPC